VQVRPGERRTIGDLLVTVHASTASAVQESPPGSKADVPASTLVLRLTSGQRLPLAEGVRLSGKDIPGLKAAASDSVVAAVMRHPRNPTILGLQNLSSRSWQATVAHGMHRQVESGKSVQLAVGTKIAFGHVEGEIQA